MRVRVNDSYNLAKEYQGNFELAPNGSTSFTWRDPVSQMSISVLGENITYENGLVTSGAAYKIMFGGPGSSLDAFVATGVQNEFDMAKLGGAMAESPRRFISQVFAGNDLILANDFRSADLRGYAGNDVLHSFDGNDFLWGGRGHDKLIGGAGSDTFWFEWTDHDRLKGGHDVIRDFDANGGGTDQDYLSGIGVVDIKHHNHGTLVEYADGGSFLLRNVDRAEIGDDDFVFSPPALDHNV